MSTKIELWNFLMNGKKRDHSGSWFSGNSLAKRTITLRVINNKDGSPRWIFPSTLLRPDFLKFYAVTSWRSRLIYTMFKLLFYTRLIGLVSTKVKVYYHQQPFFFNWLPDECDQFALFAGTIGPNQKILTVSRDFYGKATFSKIAYGRSAVKLIHNEIAVLYFLSSKNISKFHFPRILKQSNNSLTVEEVSFKSSNNRLTKAHSDAIRELYCMKSYLSPVANGTIDGQVSGIIEIEPKNLTMKTLKKSLIDNYKVVKRKNVQVKVGFGHGDFTPWNCAVDNDKLVIIDWEMADEYPLLFDVFHFIVQDLIMNTTCDQVEILAKVKRIMSSIDMVNLCSEHKISWKDQFEAYLLTVSLYYFKVYHKQKEIHFQAFRAMKVWSELLNELTVSQDKGSLRKLFTSKIFEVLKTKEYALVKNGNALIADHRSDSDLDLFITKRATKETVKWVKSQPEISKIDVTRLSYMTIASIYFKDGSFLSIDFIHQLKQRSLEYLSIDEALKSGSMSSEGVKTPSIKCDFEYIMLFYLLNRSPIPFKYWSYVEQLETEERETFFLELKDKWRFSADNFEQFFVPTNTRLIEELRESVSRKVDNTGLKGLRNKLVYIADSIRRLSSGRGVVISFSGVDGAGKSTIIRHVKKRLEERFRRKVVVLRHRPSVLPILSSFVYGRKNAESRAANSLPRQGKNVSILSSLCRFSYYLLDYFLGQVVVWSKHTLRGEVILYDRYYFDFIEDAKRSNIILPKWFRKVFYRVIYKPSLNIFLYAKPELILERKQELTHSDIVELTGSYQGLFQELDKKYSEKYVSIENEEIDITLNQVESLITAVA